MHFYPRPPRGGRPAGARGYAACGRISIHALREEGDRDKAFAGAEWCISIHALREEGDILCARPSRSFFGFLSTPSARRATMPPFLQIRCWNYFYPRPPRGGRLRLSSFSLLPSVFLSTPSARRATLCFHRIGKGISISIHALREEGDPGDNAHCRRRGYFYPRPPRGGRPLLHPVSKIHAKISIHALREEGDWRGFRRPAFRERYFYPRPPRGGRLKVSGGHA